MNRFPQILFLAYGHLRRICVICVPTKPATRWRCINKQGVNLRTAPNTGGRIVRAIAYDETIEVDLVKTEGDVEAVRGDNRWLHAASGEGFAWAGNFRRS